MANDDNTFQSCPEQNESNAMADTHLSNVEYLPRKNRNEDGEPPHRRYLPIEADETLKRKIGAETMMLEHGVWTLNDLMLAYHYDEEKHRVFGIITADQRVFDLLDRLLNLAIEQIQSENATVVGVVMDLIMNMIEGDRVMRKYLSGPFLHHARSSAEIKAHPLI